MRRTAGSARVSWLYVFITMIKVSKRFTQSEKLPWNLFNWCLTNTTLNKQIYLLVNKQQHNSAHKMVEKFQKSWLLLAHQSRLSQIIDWWHCSTFMDEYRWKISRQYFNCLPQANVSVTKILKVKIALRSSFLGL